MGHRKRGNEGVRTKRKSKIIDTVQQKVPEKRSPQKVPDWVRQLFRRSLMKGL